ncbi:MAG: PAS domain S-box protein [Ignavibacteria bacterium]|nr:PAS domain S-box protein [Ignavibacteria bacterium]
MDKKRHRLLERQIKKIFLPEDLEHKKLNEFIDAINDAYLGFEDDHNQSERTLELSLNELFKANKQLNDSKLLLENTVQERTVELVKALEKIKESENRFRNLVQNSSDIITILDSNGIIKYESPSFYRIFGYDEKDVIGQNAFSLIHPDDVEKVQLKFLNLLANPGKTLSVEFRYKTASGSYRSLESVGNNLLSNESISGIVVNSRDIEDRKKAEAEIIEKSQILNGILSSLPVLIYKINREGKFTEAAGSEKSLGIEGDKLIGVDVKEHFPGIYENIPKALSGEYFSFVLASSMRGSVKYFENFLFEDKNSKGCIVGFALDITENKVAEKKLKEYSSDLEKINKELDQFAYVVSHDLKAPLRAINNLSQWIEEDLEGTLEGETAQNFELLRGRVNRMESLINGILEYSRAGRMKFNSQSVALNSFIEEIIQNLAPPENIKITIQQEMPTISTEKVALEQVFSNLISNAIKYNTSENPEIKIRYKELERHFEFCIEDNGPGIAPEFHDKIFIIFQTLQSRDKIESTGVGLAIVKKIVEDKNGTVWVDSDKGKGTRFYFTWHK